MIKGTKSLPQGFEVRCDVVGFMQKIGFVFYKADIDNQREWIVEKIDVDGLHIKDIANEAVDIEPLFTLTHQQVRDMISNIDTLLNARGLKIDLRSVLDAEIAGLKAVIAEKDKQIDLLKQVCGDYKGNSDRMLNNILLK